MIKFFIFSLILIILSGNQIACSSNLPVNLEIPNNQEAVEIRDLEFFTWWWSDEQSRAGIDADHPPTKNFYMQLNRWQHDGMNGTANPDKFDINFHVINNRDKINNLKVKATVEFQIATYKLMYDDKKSNETINESLDKVPWTNQEEIYSSVITLSPKGQEEITVRDFNLRRVQENLKKNDWAWYMRTIITVEDMEGTIVSSKEKKLEIVPLD